MVHLHLDSRDRDRTVYPDQASYTFRLGTPIRNVHTCIVTGASIPVAAINHAYLVVHLDGLVPRGESSNDVLQGAAAILVPEYSGSTHYRVAVENGAFPLGVPEKISRLKVALYTPEGDLVSLGSDGGATPDTMVQWRLSLEFQNE